MLSLHVYIWHVLNYLYCYKLFLPILFTYDNSQHILFLGTCDRGTTGYFDFCYKNHNFGTEMCLEMFHKLIARYVIWADHSIPLGKCAVRICPLKSSENTRCAQPPPAYRKFHQTIKPVSVCLVEVIKFSFTPHVKFL